MKKKLFFLSLALVLVATIAVPATVLAAPPTPATRHFSIVMTPNTIDDTVVGAAWPVRDTAATNVWPIVDVVNGAPAIAGWIVEGRSIYGNVSGDINGKFTFTYGGVLDMLQSGSMQGIVTIQAGGLDNIYLAALGDLDAQVKNYYTFGEIQAWCTGVGISVGMFFAQIYNVPDLALLPDAVLKNMYETGQLPPLPKTLSAVFSGMVKIDAGTGTYSGIRGVGQFGPLNNKPLVLSVFPNQHVYKIEGALKMTGTYTRGKLRGIGNIDRDKLIEVIGKIIERLNK